MPAMPKITIAEDRNLLGIEYDLWLSGELGDVLTELQPTPSQFAFKYELGERVLGSVGFLAARGILGTGTKLCE